MMRRINVVQPRIWGKCSFLGPYAPLILVYVVGLPLLSLSRIGLMFWQSERMLAVGHISQILIQGLRVDIILLGLIVLIPLMLSPLFVAFKLWKPWRYFTYCWFVIGLVLVIFLEAATPGFMGEYNVRPNRLFIEYLKYPHEVLPMLWNGFRVHVFLGLITLALATVGLVKFAAPWLKQKNQLSNWHYWLSIPIVIFLTALSIRSTLGHRPANPALFAITNDPTVNSLVLNSAYSVAYAVYNLKHEADASEVYGQMTTEEMLATFKSTREMLHDRRALTNDPQYPTLALQPPSQHRDKPLNVVIILEESLGATFVESLGGLPVTPELEKLKSDGWWFENLYATGTRSVRGIEAVVSGFMPTPAQSTVKLSLSQNHFVTLASLLRDQGYSTEFIYGGESHFDNMRGFFMGNGFQRIIDQHDFYKPAFTGSWGVSDEDLLNRTHEELSKHHATNKPFFTLAFTSSNHSPFEFPDDRIALYDKEKATENNAVKYADYALGQFFKKAKASDYYKDTIFLVVADHDIRVRVKSLIPVKNFHIPAVILGADIAPKKIHTVASQIDLPTTLLSLAGINITSPMIGRDISSEADDLPGRAMMQYQDNYGWMEGQELVVLSAEKPATFAHYDRKAEALTVTAKPKKGQALKKRALAHVLLASWLYREKRYDTPHP